MTLPISREACIAKDAADPLAFARSRFELPEGVIYLDGNSLGALPRATAHQVAELVQNAWGQGLIRSWNSANWITAPQRVGAKIARLIGAEADEVIVADSTSINLFKGISAARALRPDRRVILTEPGNFPTDLYMLQGLKSLCPDLDIRIVARDQIEAALDGSVAVLCLTHVHYKSGEMFDMPRLAAAAHAEGALVLFDLSHSAGAVEVDLKAAEVDFAIGCGYKYLNGGPGAPAFIFAARRHHAQMRQPLSGWMGHARPFDFVDDYAPASGMAQFLSGTPAILGLAALEAGLATFDGLTLAALREKSVLLSETFIALVEAKMPGVFGLASPRNPAHRGSQVSLTHRHGYEIMANLIAQGVIGDFRAPDHLRFGFTPLYLRFQDVYDATEHLSAIMQAESWRAPHFATRAAVT